MTAERPEPMAHGVQECSRECQKPAENEVKGPVWRRYGKTLLSLKQVLLSCLVPNQVREI